MDSLLPPELWDYVLTFIDPTSLQSTALALSRAIPSSSISPSLLWRHLHLSRESQSLQCISKLRGLDQGVRESIKTVRATAFREDPQQLVNLLLSLPSARSLQLHIGPLFSPEQLDELLTPASSLRSQRFTQLSQLAFRFNPYCMERSYFVFLKGTYFDSIVLNLSSWTLPTAPSMKRLSFAQDLSPNHGVKRKDTPAFGLHEVRQELNEIEQQELEEEEEERIITASRQPPASGRFGRKNKIENGKMDFAQPIVFFRLDCLATLSVSPIGRQLTHLTLRLPRRNLLTALTLQTSPSNPPFPSVTHLDLSTTHILDDARFPTMLRLMPGLESLVLDRCTGLISQDAVDENTAIQTMRWLGKCCGGIGFSRAEEISRSWKRIVKSRPTDAPNISHSSSPSSHSTLIPPVKELFLIPSPPNLTHLGLGLHDNLSNTSTTRVWTKSFEKGYVEAIEKSKGRIQEFLDRWELWERQGKLLDGTRRLCTFSDALTTPSFRALHRGWSDVQKRGEEELDPLFEKFMDSRGLVKISPSIAYDLLESHDSKLRHGIELCFEPDCSDLPGVPRLSFGENGKDSVEDREEREKVIDLVEREDEERRRGRKHVQGCAHLRGREAWEVDK